MPLNHTLLCNSKNDNTISQLPTSTLKSEFPDNFQNKTTPYVKLFQGFNSEDDEQSQVDSETQDEEDVKPVRTIIRYSG